MKHDWKIVEKKNHLHVHQLFTNREAAEKSLREVIPEYVRLGYYMDKTLTADDFVILSPEGEIVTEYCRSCGADNIGSDTCSMYGCGGFKK